MTRILLFLCAALVVVTLIGLAVTTTARAVQDSRDLARDIAVVPRRTLMEKISFAALMLLMLGVTSGLLGGL
ncbi:hypothetical protein ACEWPM_005495 [Roseovarius sp. S4756]|uniref:hypothetical protein n=1 Tax=Roseovarius maritimus TaxID=3342637 RepID=UPI003728CAFA